MSMMFGIAFSPPKFVGMQIVYKATSARSSWQLRPKTKVIFHLDEYAYFVDRVSHLLTFI